MRASPADPADTLFLFSPSASYPQPFACLIDREARLVHAWSSPLDQPELVTDPPSYLRGWNHVELDPRDGSLYATVPLHSLLKLRPDSSLAWRAELPVHHDLDLAPGGQVYVLTEQPRLIGGRDGAHVLLDNSVTILSPDGQVLTVCSLYDALTSHPALHALIDQEISRRRASADAAASPMTVPVTVPVAGLRAGRGTSRILRDLPGAPSDVLHANTVEVLQARPDGLWADGDVLVCLRNLNLIAVLDPAARKVRWWWGPGELSAPHQPSIQPGGTVLVFDNGQAARRSRVVEVDPATGRLLWQLVADPPGNLFCALAGGCQRLPSGAVLISDAQAGRALEVTPDGRVTWAVQIRTRATTTTSSRAQFYRMAAVPASAAALLYGDDDARLAAARLRCEVAVDIPDRFRSIP